MQFDFHNTTLTQSQLQLQLRNQRKDYIFIRMHTEIQLNIQLNPITIFYFHVQKVEIQWLRGYMNFCIQTEMREKKKNGKIEQHCGCVCVCRYVLSMTQHNFSVIPNFAHKTRRCKASLIYILALKKHALSTIRLKCYRHTHIH